MKKDIKSLLAERNLLLAEIGGIEREIWEILKENRTKLDKKTYSVLKARMHEKKTFEEIGKEFNLTRERIRQIVSKGIEDIYFLQGKEKLYLMGYTK